jgi:hypothetical protein
MLEDLGVSINMEIRTVTKDKLVDAFSRLVKKE